MSAGRLRERVKFQRRVNASDGAGNRVGSWQDLPGLSNEPASIEPLRGGEEIVAAKLQAKGLFSIRVRGSSLSMDLGAEDRVLDLRSARVFNIQYVENKDMRGRFVTLVCETGGADG